ncbi:MAG: DEAD/DEAH box helicase [Bacteroidota bacterium]
MTEHHPALATLHPAVRGWFTRAFGVPSPPQALGWPRIAAGKNVLLLAPTGSGKTLAAFLQCLSHLYQRFAAGDPLDDGVRVLYISPLKALNNDIHKNLALPLDGIAAEAARMGLELPRPRAAVRTGDTPAAERRAIMRQPPQILITTPESLFLLLTSKARQVLRRVEYVIVDEVHALFPTKRGVHLALSLEHLEALTGRPFQRIGLSATLRPLAEVAAYLGGGTLDAGGTWRARPVETIDTGQRKELDLSILLPVDDLRSLPEKTVWPPIYRQLLGLVRTHRSTLVFVNNRRQAERITANLNDLAGDRIAMTHHGSLSKEKRLEAEEQLKAGKLPCLVATSSLELGIDVGAIDLVVQIESPKEVARGLQRVGRAGHLVGLPSKGRIIPKTQADLLECAAVVREMRTGLVEEVHAPENCLDVLAQQLVGMVCPEDRRADDLFRLARRAYPYRALARAQFDRVLGMLAGGYEDGRALDLQPRLYWDRVNGLVRAADRGRRLVYTSGGTIPDRGYFGVYLEGRDVRLGELEEEFVFERRLGERFVLGTTAWRIEEIRRDRVIVSPAKRGEAMIPFWKGEVLGRSYELGCRFGAFLEELAGRLGDSNCDDWLARECLLEPKAARSLRHYLLTQVRATGALPSHRRLVIEEFQDELGEWRILLHTPFGARIHAALALLLKEQIRARDGLEVETMHDDNGLLFHCPGAPHPPHLDPAALPLETLPETLAETARGSNLFALLFRENAARALLLPKAPYGRKRTPLWLARLRAADLLQTVSDRPDFPIVLETLRECLAEHYDLQSLQEVLSGLRAGAIAIHRVRSPRPSPFSQALQFNFLGTYMYVPDLPKGEQRFRALGLSREALRELLGSEDLRGLLDPKAIAAVDEEARGMSSRQAPRNADELHAWLRGGRELAVETGSVGPFLDALKSANRVVLLSWKAGNRTVQAWVAAEDASDYLAALPGCRVVWPESLPPQAPSDPAEARRRLLRRFTKTHGPLTLGDLEASYGLTRAEAAAELTILEADGLVQSGEFSPGVVETEWCDVDLLQRIHRMSLAKARKEIEPRGPAAYAAFLARWQGLANPGLGPQALAQALTQLAGLWLPAGAWGGGVLPVRVRDYQEAMLEKLVATGQSMWVARGAGTEMKVGFIPQGELTPQPPLFREREGEGAAAPGVSSPATAELQVRDLLANRGALFLPQIVQQTNLSAAVVLEALEMLMAGGLVTNDTLGPIRYFTARRPEHLRYHLTQQTLAEMGRWSTMAPGPPPDPEMLADLLLRRYGLVTRDVVTRDCLSWDDLLPVLERREAIGKVRRGYFVDGLGGLQYALPEAVERLRLPLEEGMPQFWALLRCDPANPYGSVLAMPEAGIQAEILVLRRGAPVLAAGGKKMRIAALVELRDEALTGALAEFGKLASRQGRVTVAEYNGRPVLETEAAEILKGLGFERGYKEMVRWE